MGNSYLTPCVVGPLGVQPETIIFEAYNESTVTYTVGQIGMFDQLLSVATTFTIGAQGSAWTTMIAPIGTEGNLTHGFFAVYIGRMDGSTGSLADGEKGRWMLMGETDAAVTNGSGGVAPIGSPCTCQTGIDARSLITHQTPGSLTAERKIVAVLEEQSADADSGTLRRVYFNGLGFGATA